MSQFAYRHLMIIRKVLTVKHMHVYRYPVESRHMRQNYVIMPEVSSQAKASVHKLLDIVLLYYLSSTELIIASIQLCRFD